MINFIVNGREAFSEQPGDTPLLWVIREELGLTGTKFGCGIAQCGACTVHVNGTPVRSCSTPVSAAAGRRSRPSRAVAGSRPSVAEGLDCRTGAAVRLLPVRPDHAGRRAARQEQKSDTRADCRHMNGNICRCGGPTRASCARSSAPRRRCSHAARDQDQPAPLPPGDGRAHVCVHFHRQSVQCHRAGADRHIQRLGIHRGRRHRNRDDSFSRDGAGHSHVAAAHPRRGIGRELGQGDDAVRPAEPKDLRQLPSSFQRRHARRGQLDRPRVLDACAWAARRRDAY